MYLPRFLSWVAVAAIFTIFLCLQTGIVSDQAEYYLREFYQDASPEFIKDEEGFWIDGMTQPSMVDAVERMRTAYAEGLINLEIVTNKISTYRDKWYAGNVGVFTYWASN